MRQMILRPLVLAAFVVALPAVGQAQELQFYRVGFVGGLSSSDQDAGDLDNSALQASFGFATGERSRLGVRVGRLGFGDDDVLNDVVDPDLTYVTVAGEVLFEETIYDSGIYLGLGGYRLQGDDGARISELGVTLGYTGDFEITRHLSVALELAGHFADFADDKLFGQAMAGIALHF